MSRFPWRAPVWLYVGSVLAAIPGALLLSGIAYVAYGTHPRGDAILFDADATALGEWLLRERATVLPLALGWAGMVAIADYGRIVPIGSVVVSVNQHDGQPAYTFSQALSRAAPYLGKLARWVTGVRLVQLACGGLGFAVVRAIRGDATTPARDLACLVPVAIAAACISIVGVAHDVARVALIRGQERPWIYALTHLRRVAKSWALWLAWAALGLAFMALGSAASGLHSLAVAWVVHQAIHFLRAGVQVGWLAHLARVWNAEASTGGALVSSEEGYQPPRET